MAPAPQCLAREQVSSSEFTIYSVGGRLDWPSGLRPPGPKKCVVAEVTSLRCLFYVKWTSVFALNGFDVHASSGSRE